MSHVTTIETEEESYDIDALKQMCLDEGWEWREGQTTYKWYGTHVGDYPIPAGFTKADMGRCNHAIRIPGASYEIGVVNKGGKVKLLWDFWGSGGLPQKLGQKAEKLKQAYTVAKVKVTAKKHGRKYWTKESSKPGWKRVFIEAT